jgi:WD40 repeat protein
VTGKVGRVYVQRAAATEGSMVVQVGGDLYVSEEGLYALWAAAETVPGECPYPGLDAFGPSQARWFFGRELLTGDLLDLLDAFLRAGYGGPVVVVGPSGAGKSSLLGAGLMKALQDGRLAAAGSNAWPILTITPGKTPLATLTATIRTCAAALTGAGVGSPPGPAGSPVAWESAFATLRAALRSRSAYQAPLRVTVVVDQFEEFFTADRDDAGRQAFLEALAALAAPGLDGPVGLVVLGMRADFYGRAAEYPLLRRALQSGQLVLGAMTPAEVAQAITWPARAAGLRLEAGLTVAGYEATGGIGGAIAKAADDVYTGLDADGQRTAQQLFLALVQVGSRDPNDEGIPDTRRRLGRERVCSLTSDSAMASEVLDRFITARLITSGGQTVEISHDALLSRWPRLRDWIGQDRSGHLIHQSLEAAAQAWDREGRDSAALYGGIRLAAAHQWADDPGHPRSLSSVARDFLAASGRRRRRVIRRRNGIIAILAALSAGMALLTGYAFNQRAAAVQQRNQAIDNQVVAEAVQFGDSNIPLAAQLTLAAYRIQPTQDLRSRLLNTENTPLPSILFAPSESSGSVQVYQVAFSRDGHTLASADSRGTIRLWDLAAGPAHPRQLGQLRSEIGPLTSLAFSPSGHILAVSGAGTMIWLWDLADPAHPRHLGTIGRFTKRTDPVENVSSLAFSPSGHMLAAGVGGGMVRLWDLADPAHPRQLGQPLTSNPDSSAVSVAFSPDRRTLASGGSVGPIRLWDLADPAHPRPVGQPLAAGDDVTSVTFSPGRRILAAGTGGGIVRLWDLANPAHPRQLGQPQTSGNSAVDSVTFSPNGHTLASGDADGTIRFWDISNLMNPQPFGQLLTSGGSNAVDSIAFSPDGHTLASGSDDGTDRLWNLPMTVLADSNIVDSLAYSPRGHTLASGDDDGTIRLWDLADPARPRLLSQPQAGGRISPVGSVAFSTDGSSLAAAESNHTIRLWDVTDPAHPRPLAQLGRPQTGINAIPMNSAVFSPDGHTLASDDALGTIQLWDVTDPAHPRPLGRPETNSGDTLAFGSHGHTLAIASSGSTLQLWDLTHLAHPRMLSEPKLSKAESGSSASSAAFSPDGRTLASGITDGTIQLWDVTDPAHPRSLPQLGHPEIGGTSYVGSAAFSPDGHTLASVYADGTVQLWDVTRPAHARLSGQLGQPQTGISFFYPVAFSPDGHTLASGSAGGIQLWNLNVQYATERICATAGELTRQQWNQYIPQLPYQPLCER